VTLHESLNQTHSIVLKKAKVFMTH